MEEVFQRFPHLYEYIFKSLDNETLANCEEASKVWYSYISTIITKRGLEYIQETFRRFHQLHVEFRLGFHTTRKENIFNAAGLGDLETAQKLIMEESCLGFALFHQVLLSIFFF